MKRSLIYFFLLVLIGVQSCEPLDSIQRKLIGTWEEIYPVYNPTYFTFDKDGNMQIDYPKESVVYKYEIIEKDSLRISLEDIFEKNCQVIFYNEDSVEIVGFKHVATSMPPYTIIKRTK